MSIARSPSASSEATSAASAPHAAGPAGSAPALESAAFAGRARSLVWQLQSSGLTERQAGALLGLVIGLKPARDGWTAREIEYLRFLRAMVRSGRIVR